MSNGANKEAIQKHFAADATIPQLQQLLEFRNGQVQVHPGSPKDATSRNSRKRAALRAAELVEAIKAAEGVKAAEEAEAAQNRRHGKPRSNRGN